MFFAINSNTNEKLNSLTIETNPSYQFIDEDIWFADPDEIESCPKGLDINKIQVRFRKGNRSIINWNGTEYATSPHFFIPNKSKLGINVIPESKEHKQAKNWIYNRLQTGKLQIAYSSINKPYHYENTVNLFDLPLDKDKMGIEVNSSTFGNKIYRRADVICPFLKKDSLLGLGIVFEIQFTNQKETTKISRELDWAIRGYSVAWLTQEDFNEISDILIDLKKDYVNVNSYANLLKQNNKNIIRDLKFTTQELCREFDSKKEEVKDELLKNYLTIAQSIDSKKLKALEISKEEIREIIRKECEIFTSNFQPQCPKCKIPMILKKWKGGAFWGCSNYPSCSVTSSYLD